MHRPFLHTLGSPILDLAHAGGRLYALTHGGLVVLDGCFETVARSAGHFRDGSLSFLPDGRVVVESPRIPARLGRAGEPLEALPEGAEAVLPTELGFVSPLYGKLLVEADGRRKKRSLPLGVILAVRCGEGIAVLGAKGLTLVDPRGEVLKESAEKGMSAPVSAPFGMVLQVGSKLHLLGKQLEVLERRRTTGWGTADAHEDGVLLCEGKRLSFWSPARSWTWEGPSELWSFCSFGAKVVVGAFETPDAWILSEEGVPECSFALPGRLAGAWPLGDGIALQAAGHPSLLWRRSDGSIEELAHDEAPLATCASPAGLFTSEGPHLLEWRPDAQGPERAPVETALPLGVPLMIKGERVVLREPGRFLVKGSSSTGAIAVEPDASYRYPASRSDALALVEALCAGRVKGSVVKASAEEPLAQRPLAETAALYARALYKPSGLTPQQLELAEETSGAFYEELALALEVGPLELEAALRARSFPLEAPRRLEGYQYVGAFECKGELWACDPCQLGRQGGAVPLHVVLPAKKGAWHAYLRTSIEEDGERTAELVVTHAEGLDRHATRRAGYIPVDSGTAGFFNRGTRASEGSGLGQGVTPGRRGVHSHTGYGDGSYIVYVARKGKRVVKARIPFLGREVLDRTMPRPSVYRAWSAGERYAVGDGLAHPEYGEGVVLGLVRGDKVRVGFAKRSAYLPHAGRGR